MFESIYRRSKFIEAEIFTQCFRTLEDHGIDGNSYTVGDAIIFGKIGDNCSGGANGMRPKFFGKGRTGSIQGFDIGSDSGIAEIEQHPSSGDTHIKTRIDQGFQIWLNIVGLSTLTEEPGMAGGSVKALIDRRYAPGDNLYLHSVQTFMVLIVIIDNAL